MSHQMEEAPGIIQGKSFLNRISRKIVFIKMVCNPIFVLIYFCFCRTLYQFCMYGEVKKRGTILGICVLFFLAYLILYFVIVSKMKVSDLCPKNEAAVKSYGFYKHYFYAFGPNKIFYLKECDEKKKDYLRLKYSKLPRYRAFFWKIPSVIVLILITTMTITGVIKSATNFNGKLAWYLFDLYHTPIVAETEDTLQEVIQKEDTEIIIPEEIFAGSDAASEEVFDINSDMQKSSITLLDVNTLTEGDLPIFSEDEGMNKKYYEAIMELEMKGILPNGNYAYNGEPEDFNRVKEYAYNNKIATYDYVGEHGDGKELIIRVEGTCTADSSDYIFRYNKNMQSFECIYIGYYGGDFYKSGIIYTPFSHGDMYQDDFWPHDIYAYDKALGKFKNVGSTGEIDLEIYPERETEYQKYDLDGDKKVYFFSDDMGTKYMDHDEFYEWESNLLESGKIEVDWYELK